jgi:hypothetical protein
MSREFEYVQCHSEPFGFAQDKLREESRISLLCLKKSEILRHAQDDRQSLVTVSSKLISALSMHLRPPFFGKGGREI